MPAQTADALLIVGGYRNAKNAFCLASTHGKQAM
jgi:hypothetical protein